MAITGAARTLRVAAFAERRFHHPELAVPVIAAAVYVSWIWRPASWVDEDFTASVMRVGWLDVFRGLRVIDAVHGVYYLALWPWGQVSTDVVWLRVPSAAADTYTRWFVRKLPLMIRLRPYSTLCSPTCPASPAVKVTGIPPSESAVLPESGGDVGGRRIRG